MQKTIIFIPVMLGLLLAGCATNKRVPMQPVSTVDLNRFMGAWYVIAGIPTAPERGAINPIERYELNDNGTVATTFSYTKGDKQKVLNATGFIQEGSKNAIWGMQFIWPIKADYRIVYLDTDYKHTIVGREKRDYLWIMSREAPVSDATLDELIDIAISLGYDKSKIVVTSWQTDADADKAQ
jgi:apolipoprotein D and lipocalin family protein